jgi:hypothetical protein
VTDEQAVGGTAEHRGVLDGVRVIELGSYSSQLKLEEIAR